MNMIERRQYEMLVRVRDFGDNYGHLFPASSVARESFTAVAAAIKELDTQDLTHMAASAPALLERKTRAREALLARLQAIGQTARVLARDAPGLDQQFRVPADPSRRAARATTRTALSSGLAAVRSLNVVVINHLRHDEVPAAVWEQARRIVYPERAKRTGAAPEPAAVGAAPELPSGNKAA